jgi:hypothetical protein
MRPKSARPETSPHFVHSVKDSTRTLDLQNKTEIEREKEMDVALSSIGSYLEANIVDVTLPSVSV